jgi:hypothetical protein
VDVVTWPTNSGADKARFYRMARRSAVECAAVFDIAKRLYLADTEQLAAAREDVVRIVSMLVRLNRSARRKAGHGQGHGQGHGEPGALRATGS